MGISTTVEHLSQAPVSSIHYSKNFHLTDGSTPYHYISKIKEAGMKLSLDINQTDYRNEGHSYKWHCNAYEVVFYDKIKDLEKAKISPKRGIENDSALQISLLNSLRKQNKLEVLRMEVRLNKRQKMKQLFKTLGIKSDLTFKKLFKPAISRKVLLYYLDELESKRPILFDQRAVHDKALLVSLVINNPELSPKRIMQLFGLKKAFDAMPAGELRTIFAGCNTQSWRRLIADAVEVKLPATPSPFRVLREHLAK